MPKKIEVYECEHCKKHITRTKNGMKRHEKKCFWNPQTKSCMTCENYIGGGHYANQCNHDYMNDQMGSRINWNIKELKHDCKLYVYDEMTLEERKKCVNELNYDAKADWDDYHSSIL